MTLYEAITNFRRLRETPFDDDMLTFWISECNAIAADEVISKFDPDVRAEKLDYRRDMNTELCIPFPDENVYFLYLCLKNDIVMADRARYNMTERAFEDAWRSFADRYTRNHMPPAGKITLGGGNELFHA